MIKNIKNVVIANAFSIGMISTQAPEVMQFMEYPLEEVKGLLEGKEVASVVGHADTAAVYSGLLGVNIPVNRVNFKWPDGVEGFETALLVGQIQGGRLPEGATTLPEGASIKWVLVNKV